MNDIVGRPRFFEKTFLLANICINIALRMLFLNLSNAEIHFLEQKLNKKLYTTIGNLPTIKQVELIRKKKFAIVIFDPDDKIFVIHIVFLTSSDIYPFYKA